MLTRNYISRFLRPSAGTFVSLLIGLQQFFLLSSSSSELLDVPESMTKWFGYFSLVNLQVCVGV